MIYGFIELVVKINLFNIQKTIYSKTTNFDQHNVFYLFKLYFIPNYIMHYNLQ